MLLLLQQRTKLSGQIGGIKRRAGAVIYVPERERELIARLTAPRKGQPSARAVAAIYREILSSSRAAQGQMPIGILQASAEEVLPKARCGFGACDRFQEQPSWKELMTNLRSGALSLALLTGRDLTRVLRTKRWRGFDGLAVVGEMGQTGQVEGPLERRIFVVTPVRAESSKGANRVLILIECKSTQNAIKSLLNSMPDPTIHAQHLTLRASPGPRGAVAALVEITLPPAAEAGVFVGQIQVAARTLGIPVSILGVYPRSEEYGG